MSASRYGAPNYTVAAADVTLDALTASSVAAQAIVSTEAATQQWATGAAGSVAYLWSGTNEFQITIRPGLGATAPKIVIGVTIDNSIELDASGLQVPTVGALVVRSLDPAIVVGTEIFNDVEGKLAALTLTVPTTYGTSFCSMFYKTTRLNTDAGDAAGGSGSGVNSALAKKPSILGRLVSSFTLAAPEKKPAPVEETKPAVPETVAPM